MPELVGIERFAELMNVSVRYAQKLVRDGNAPRHYRFGRTVKFQETDIVDWMKTKVVNPENK